MNCQEINAQLGTLLDQALEPQLATAIERHLTRCAKCQVELEQLCALKAALQNVTPPVPSVSLDERVMAAFERRHQPLAQVISKVDVMRTWLFSTFIIPKPALALLGVLLVGTSALAYKTGEIMGTRLPVIDPPVLVHNQTTRVAPVEPVRVVYVKTPGECPRSNSRPRATLAQIEAAKTAETQPATLQLETRAYTSEAGIDYATSAPGANFELVKDPNVRVIKGGNQ